MSYSEPIDIFKLFNKKILFLDIETIGLPEQKGDANTKPENKFYDYTDNEKYEKSRLLQFSYFYYEDYDKIIPEANDITNYIVKPKNFKIDGIEYHGITEDEAYIKGEKLSSVIKEFASLILNNEIDYIVGYNPYFDINIMMNELYRINWKETITKIEELIKNKQIIDIAQICIKLKLNNYKKIYQISKQSDIYKQLFNEEQTNTHNSLYDVLNLIKITKSMVPLIIKHYIKNDDFNELKNYINHYFSTNYIEQNEDEIHNNITPNEPPFDLNIYNKYLKYPEKIKIKDALKIYYGDKYDENDYNIFLKTKKFNNISLFPHFDIIYKQVCFIGNEYMPIEIINIKNEEINLNYFVNSILQIDYAIRLKINNLYILDYKNDYNIIELFHNISKIGNYEHTFNLTNINYEYIIKYDEEKIKKSSPQFFNNELNLKILGYNLFYGENTEQIDYINTNIYDILFLSEASKDVLTNFKNYNGFLTKSHCGYTYLGINNKLKIKNIKKIFEKNGIIVIHLEINNKELILASLHLSAFKENIIKRQEQLKIIMDELLKLNLINIPLIMGGDTNMRHEENVNKFELNDVYLIKKEKEYEITYPNRKFKSDKLAFTPKNNFRYDRFFIKNCECIYFKTIENNVSDHLAIETSITI